MVRAKALNLEQRVAVHYHITITYEEKKTMTEVNTTLIRALADKYGQVPFPKQFGQDGNAIALVSVTRNALKRAGWPSDALAEFQRLALQNEYNEVINCCLTCFSHETDND